MHSFKDGSERSVSASKMQSARTVPRVHDNEQGTKSKEKKTSSSKDAASSPPSRRAVRGGAHSEHSVLDTTPPTVQVIDDDDDDDARTLIPKKTTKASKYEGSGLKKVKKHSGKLAINKKKKKSDKLASEVEKRKAAEREKQKAAEREKEKEESERRERRKAEREKLKEAKEKQRKEALLREKLKQQKQLRERLKEEKLKEKKLLKARKREQAAKEKELNKGKKNLNSPGKRAKAKRIGATNSPNRRYGTVSPASRFEDDDDDKAEKLKGRKNNFPNLQRESPVLSATTPQSKKTAATELINLILRAPNGKIKHVVHKSEATIRDVLAAHGKDPLQYRFLFNGHRVSRDVTVQELEKSNKKKGPLTLQLEKLVYVEIYLGDNVFEERLPGSMPITKLFEDLKLRGLEKNITDLVCQNAEGIEFGKELTLDELDVQTGSSKNTPLALHIVHGDWDSD